MIQRKYKGTISFDLLPQGQQPHMPRKVESPRRGPTIRLVSRKFRETFTTFCSIANQELSLHIVFVAALSHEPAIPSARYRSFPAKEPQTDLDLSADRSDQDRSAALVTAGSRPTIPVPFGHESQARHIFDLCQTLETRVCHLAQTLGDAAKTGP